MKTNIRRIQQSTLSTIRGLTFTTAQEAFEYMFDVIHSIGTQTRIGTKALYNIGFYILNPWIREIETPWRNWSKKYAEREWQWYLSQNRSVEELKKHAPLWDKMHGGDNIVNSNYGWQWGRNNQLDKCIEQLKKDISTRRAWISIFDGKEKDDYEYDTPCTLSIGFSVNPASPNHLDMTVIMRSNDLIYGFCNDQYCFSKLQELVATELNMKMGSYYHFAHDLHFYNDHLKNFKI